MAALINKVRKPKFELHLRIYDLNNVPLVSGTSHVKWHLPHSMHGEHRGRTRKCQIVNHRVDYNYSVRVSSVRIGLDKSNALGECPIEFEVTQEFSMAAGGGGGGRDERITLGIVRVNLSEYVEESENILREREGGWTAAGGVRPLSSGGLSLGDLRLGHHRSRSNASAATSGTAATTTSGDTAATGTTAAGGRDADGDFVEDGVVRRYLMQESRINGTLKIGIFMLQIDGERNYIAPPLKTAPVFTGIAGLEMTGEQVDRVAEDGQPPPLPKPRDTSEIQDMYRSALTASWESMPNELPADECIEDIFNGGDGRGSSFRLHKDGEDSGHRHRQHGGHDGHQPSSMHHETDHSNHHHFRRHSNTASSTHRSSARPGGVAGSDDDYYGAIDAGGAADSTTSDESAQLRRKAAALSLSENGGGGDTIRASSKAPRRSVTGASSSGGVAAAQATFLHVRQASNASAASAATVTGGNGGSTPPEQTSSDAAAAVNDNCYTYPVGPHQHRNPMVTPPHGHHARRHSGAHLMDDDMAAAARGRSDSASSLRTMGTVGTGGRSISPDGHQHHGHHNHHHRRGGGAGSSSSGGRAGTGGTKRAKEVDEFEVREDLVAWRLPGRTL